MVSIPYFWLKYVSALSSYSVCYLVATVSRRLRNERAYFAAHFDLFDLHKLGKQIQDTNYKGIALHI
ncbi:hypothetical protein OKIT_0407 [Oenococcus kitaharae DSM 17330]|uniref:Uncharacterized protein n=1 Tax=Oenococcus kitaharae DSM 17330 TaxID=1045004 RepID=G9WEW8_9LACO|nr:hypothetical protein OKIT_0407 [Oenococcus kitaharae DSM 17330]